MRYTRGAMPAAGGIPLPFNPTLVQLGPLLITWHGFFTAVATVVGIWLATRWSTRAGYTEDDTLSVAMWGVVGAIIGARLFHVVDQWDYYARDPIAIVKINEGGLAIFGAIVGGFITGGAYTWRKKLNVARLVDIASPCFLMGMIIGRLGDIVNGEHRGMPAPGFPLAVTYTNPATGGEVGVPVHLAVGYEMVLNLLVFGFLVWLARGVVRRSGKPQFNWEPRYARDGMLFWIFLGLYSMVRFIVQFYRVDTIFALGLTQAQLLSILTAMVAVWALVYLSSRQRSHAPLPSAQR